MGLGLTYTLTLAGSLQYCIRLSGDIENIVSIIQDSFFFFFNGLSHFPSLPHNKTKMLSAERVAQYGKLLPEVPVREEGTDPLPGTHLPPDKWPQRGEIILEDVSFRYSPHSPAVLKSICCHIGPAEKVHTTYEEIPLFVRTSALVI